MSSGIEVIGPASGEVVGTAPNRSPAELDQAFAAAAAALPAWAADEDGRRAAMVEVAGALVAAGPELLDLVIAETGKPRALAEVETIASDAWLRYYADAEIPRPLISEDDQARLEQRHRPVGVVAGIVPWNFPLGNAIWKIAPAMRTGCTLVLKPSPFTPLATVRLGEIIDEILPPGVVTVVSGDDSLGALMSSHPVPRKVAFTGSIGTGKRVAEAAAPDLKRVTLELGGNDAAILLDDVDLEAAAAAVMGTATFNAGQVCVIPKRAFVPASIYMD
ncbi:MAG: aldehyde dehydrogenase family protein, partial [Actinobacteria bacterium]|nr:aldehyde dehydrogenase family protein [Actinomycetota bacterium]